LIARYNPFQIGQPYDRARLAEFQQRLQETPYFANVVTTLDRRLAGGRTGCRCESNVAGSAH
jgi:outer membrane translocation and assembly module TamA